MVMALPLSVIDTAGLALGQFAGEVLASGLMALDACDGRSTLEVDAAPTRTCLLRYSEGGWDSVRDRQADADR